MLKKFLTGVLALTLALSMVACSTKGTTSSSGTTNKETTSGATGQLDENGVNPKGVLPIVNEKMSITALARQYPYIANMTTHDYTKWLEEQTNVHLDMQVTPDEGYQDKLNLLLSTNDYPEIIMSGAANGRTEVLKYGSTEKIYIPLNKYIDQYSVGLVKRWAESPEIKEGMTAPDGNIYVLPWVGGGGSHGDASYKFWVNTAWLDKLGLKKPTTTQEFKDMLIAFKTKDPNGNKKADEIPMSGAAKTWAADSYLYILNSFGYYDESLIKLKDGVYSSIADTAEFKEGVKFMSELFKEGLLDPASLTQDLSQLGQLANNAEDLLGSYSAGHLAMGVDVANRAVSDRFDYLLPLKGSNGYQGTPIGDKIGVGGGNFAITDKCKNPAAAYRLADMWFGDGDKEDYCYVNFYKGRTWEEPTPGAKSAVGYDAKYKDINKVSNPNDPDNSTWGNMTAGAEAKEKRLYFEFSGDIRETNNYEAYLLNATQEYKKFRAPFDQIMPDWVDEDVATDLANRFTAINDYVKASIVDFTTGKMNVDTDWQKYLDGLDKLGYAKYVADFAASRTAK